MCTRQWFLRCMSCEWYKSHLDMNEYQVSTLELPWRQLQQLLLASLITAGYPKNVERTFIWEQGKKKDTQYFKIASIPSLYSLVYASRLFVCSDNKWIGSLWDILTKETSPDSLLYLTNWPSQYKIKLLSHLFFPKAQIRPQKLLAL